MSAWSCLSTETRPPNRCSASFESHDGRALVPIPKEKHESASDIDTAVADSLKALDLKRPKSVEPENALHKSHLYLLAFAARLLEGFCIDQRTKRQN